jgi:hypothetical protein
MKSSNLRTNTPTCKYIDLEAIKGQGLYLDSRKNYTLVYDTYKQRIAKIFDNYKDAKQFVEESGDSRFRIKYDRMSVWHVMSEIGFENRYMKFLVT